MMKPKISVVTVCYNTVNDIDKGLFAINQLIINKIL